jgi:hypothetical protein
MSRDAKKSQRRAFRDLLAAVAEGAPPAHHELSLPSCSVEVNTWADVSARAARCSRVAA